jgi:hypothetical protein
MPYHEHDTDGFNCSWPIIAAAYDFSQQVVQDWFLENIIKPVMTVADGVWLDGDGPDNGAWMCSGSYGASSAGQTGATLTEAFLSLSSPLRQTGENSRRPTPR